jgi:PTH1 family peptidyl-tRNA hydrolase
MRLVVGLGNPGKDYAGHRHNIGFMALEAVARAHGLGPFRAKFQGQIADGRIGNHRVLALRPLTYMNESGRSIAAAMGFYKIAAADVVVLHDELDLAAGKLRVKSGGGHAGHNGLRSIHAHIGPDYVRVRFGIGHPGGKEHVVGHVLKDFAKADKAWLEPMMEAVAAAFPLLLDGDDGEFMNRVALAIAPVKPKGDEKGDEKGEAGAADAASEDDGL